VFTTNAGSIFPCSCGYFDIHGMNVVGLSTETIANLPLTPRAFNAGRLTRLGRTGLHGIKGFGGYLQPGGAIGEAALLGVLFGALPAIRALPTPENSNCLTRCKNVLVFKRNATGFPSVPVNSDRGTRPLDPGSTVL
jgi:hypothetical protein